MSEDYDNNCFGDGAIPEGPCEEVSPHTASSDASSDGGSQGRKGRAIEAFFNLHDKYFDLVWYARSDPDCYPDEDNHIRHSVFTSQIDIEAKYPQEVDSLKCECCSDWTHGFNSGMLAAIRYLMKAMSPSPPLDADEQDMEVKWDCIAVAEAMFPELDT